MDRKNWSAGCVCYQVVERGARHGMLDPWLQVVASGGAEVGVSAGTGATLHIGDLRGSKLSLGFETIQIFGLGFFTQVDIQAHDRLRVSPIIEATNMPSASDYGVRLLGEVGFDIGYGFAVAGRGGYQARDATSGGPSGGGTVSYAF